MVGVVTCSYGVYIKLFEELNIAPHAFKTHMSPGKRVMFMTVYTF